MYVVYLKRDPGLVLRRVSKQDGMTQHDGYFDGANVRRGSMIAIPAEYEIDGLIRRHDRHSDILETVRRAGSMIAQRMSIRIIAQLQVWTDPCLN